MTDLERDIPEMKMNKLARHLGVDFAESQKMPGERIKHKLGNLPATAYPKVRYHPFKEHVLVSSPGDEAERTPTDEGWVNSPADFPPSAVKEPTTADKLELLERLCSTLMEQSQSDDSGPMATLYRIVGERNEFARQIAAQVAPVPAAEED